MPLKHRGPAAYYGALLGKEAPKNQIPMVVDTPFPNDMMFTKPITGNSPHHRLPVPDGPPIPAIMDREEGDPLPSEEAELDGEGAEVIRANEHDTRHGDLDFRPFTFVRTSRVINAGPRKGAPQHTYQATFPFHRDDGDHAQTFCRRASNIESEEDVPSVLHRLRYWCILGRGCTSRAVLPGVHKFMDMKNIDLPIEEAFMNSCKQVCQLPIGRWFSCPMERQRRSQKSRSRIRNLLFQIPVALEFLFPVPYSGT